MVLPKDYTAQENIIADCLSEFGLRYDQQYPFFTYTVDFWVPELNMVLEADGVYGHLKKRDAARDMELMGHNSIEWVLHITKTTKQEIKEELWLALNKLSDNEEN